MRILLLSALSGFGVLFLSHWLWLAWLAWWLG